MFSAKHRLSRSTHWNIITSTCFVMWACVLCACSSTGGADGGSGTPGTAVQVTIAPSNQEQSVQLPQQSGPITGTMGFPPITAPNSNGGDLTLILQSGTNVSLEVTGPTTDSAKSARRRSSDTTAPLNPNLFECKLTAPFSFATAAPSLNFSLNSLSLPGSVPYVFAVTATPGGLTFEYPVVAQDGVINFPGDSNIGDMLEVLPTQAFLLTLFQGNGIPGSVTVTPRSATLTPVQTQDFTAAVNGLCPSGGFSWSTTGGSAGGTTTSTGPCTVTYTAPADAGSYGLTAVETDNSSNVGAASITVIPG